MHVDDNVMAAFAAGGLPELEQSQIRAHLDDCPECMALAMAVAQGYSRDATLAAGSGPNVRASQRLLKAPGTRVGEYEIERLLGAGGMGVVYAARDPRLDRVVALKLIRHHGGLDREEIAERMRRESKALARLSHANVTAVYELAAADDEIFVAIEYVAGSTLRAWVQAEPRTPAEILAVFAQAGRGLAAAHAAGIVHRDFKPDNVLIGEGGVVKVTDFGLARIAGEVAAHEARASVPTALDLTATGAVIGTPAYMAPEQFTGGVVDARADQFAFCVALYEALYGERPFRGSTFDELRSAVVEGRVAGPRDGRVPPRARRALRRGLAPSPRDRFATMDQLLAELAPRRPTALLALGGTALAAGAAIAGVMFSRSADAQVCRGAAAEVQAVWNEARRAEVQRAFAAAGEAEAFTAVARGLDDYFTSWATMQGESCAATRVHQQQSEAALDLRTACLERRRAEAGALVEVLAHADRDAVRHAREAVAGLTSLSTCIDVATLSRAVPEPADPALRARTDRARAQTRVANYREALPAFDAIVAAPGIAKMPTLEAEAQWLRAKIFSAQQQDAEAEKALFRALVQAQTARVDDLIADISVDLAHVIGFQAQRFADGLRWVDLATAAISAKGGDWFLTARLATIRGNILQRAGKFAEAEAANREALAIARSKAPGTSIEAEAASSLGMVLAIEGKFAEAIPAFESALALNERGYGARHSITASSHSNLANALGTSNQFAAARTHYERALEIDEALFGKDSLTVAAVLSNLGQALQEHGDTADARKLLERALRIREAGLGPDDPAVARTAANLGYLLLDEQAYQAALDMFTRVGAILEKRMGAEHPARADDLSGVGLAWIGLGKPERAIAPLTRAAGVIKADGDPVNLASVQAALGRALYTSGRDRAGGAKLGRAARAVLAEAGEASEATEIDRWLPAR